MTTFTHSLSFMFWRTQTTLLGLNPAMESALNFCPLKKVLLDNNKKERFRRFLEKRDTIPHNPGDLLSLEVGSIYGFIVGGENDLRFPLRYCRSIFGHIRGRKDKPEYRIQCIGMNRHHWFFSCFHP